MKKVILFVKTHWKEMIVAGILLTTAIVSFYTQDTYMHVWTWINNINIIVGFITAWIAYFTWRTAKLLRKRYEVKRIKVENSDVEKSVVLTISCGKLNEKVPKAAMQFLNDDPKKEAYRNILEKNFKYGGSLMDIENKKCDRYAHFDVETNEKNEYIRVIHLKLEDLPGIDKESELDAYMSSYATALENICILLGAEGIDTIYLFIGGPISIGYFAGERFKNNFKVYFYHNGTDKKYYLISKQAFSEYVNKNELFHIETDGNNK